MPRRPREQSGAHMYHVVQRGVGQRIIFEDDEDRMFFLSLLEKYFGAGEEGCILAWCLMSNHTHLLINDHLPELSRKMKALGVSYARYFNDRYGRSGHLFQDRFASEAVKDDAQLLQTIRYIHVNPEKAGIAPMEKYKWSSYGEYFNGEADCLAATRYTLGLFGGKGDFAGFHQIGVEQTACLDVREVRSAPRLTESEACRIAGEIAGAEGPFSIKARDKASRDAAIRDMRKAGLTVRQITRMTGISSGVVSRACKR